jgi:hypothetical protein
MILQECFFKHDKGAARSEAKQGYADNEISKMVPVLYGKHLDQEDLVGDEGSRNKED